MRHAMISVLILLLVVVLCVFSEIEKLHGDSRENKRSIFSVICVLMKEEEAYMDEWITYHKYLGFNHIHIMDNADQQTDKMRELTNVYGSYVTVQHFPGNHIQMRAYKVCVDQYNQTIGNWVAFIDTDEFIVLRKHSTINDFILEYESKCDAVSLNRVTFGSNFHKSHQNLPVLMRFTRRTVNVEISVKTIAHAPAVVSPYVHTVLLEDGKQRINVHGFPLTIKNSGVPSLKSEDVAVIYHYRTKSEEEFVQRKKHGDSAVPSRTALYANRSTAIALFEEINAKANAIVDSRAWDFFYSHSVDLQ